MSHHLPPLVADNILLLEQCADLLDALPPAIYADADERCLGGSIGGHVRHALEHYVSFLDGLEAGSIDYERRARDRRVEAHIGYAAVALRDAATALARRLAFGHLERTLQVTDGNDTADEATSSSTVGRELGFLLSHTIHHCALIAVLMRLRGLDTPAGFGFAPSTMRHRAAQAEPSRAALAS